MSRTSYQVKAQELKSIREVQLTHADDCSAAARARRVDVVQDGNIRGAVVSNMRVTAAALQHQMHAAQGVQLQIRTVQRVIQDVRRAENAASKLRASASVSCVDRAGQAANSLQTHPRAASLDQELLNACARCDARTPPGRGSP